MIMSLRILLLALCFPLFVHAQETVGPPASAPAPLKPVITGPLEVEVGKTLVLDASLSVADSRTVRYFWSLDSRLISTTEEAVLTLDKPGKYTLSLRVRDTVDGTVREEEITESVVVYVRKILLIAGPMVEEAKIELHRQSGEEEGVFVDVLHAKDLTIPLGVEDALTKLIAENAQKLRGAETIVLWADGAIAMNALSRALRQQDELLSLLRSQTIIHHGSRAPAPRTHHPWAILGSGT